MVRLADRSLHWPRVTRERSAKAMPPLPGFGVPEQLD
jgi:hypothetical protein